jgi:hypothetical protein
VIESSVMAAARTPMTNQRNGKSKLSWATVLFVAGAAIVAHAQSAEQQRELPNSPSAVVMSTSGFAGQLGAPPASQPSPQAQSGSLAKPVGTAAAAVPVTTGVAVSNSAGAAIAPGKQHRVRVLIIKVGALVGAGVAVGTVAALSSASPSRPPGTR